MIEATITKTTMIEKIPNSLILKNLSNKVYKQFGKISLKKYIEDFISKNS